MKYKLLHIVTLFLLVLMGCASEEITPMEPDQRPILLLSDSEIGFSAERFGRSSSSDSQDPQSVKAILPETVGLFGEMDGYLSDIFYNQIVYRKDGTTFSDPEVYTPVLDKLDGYLWPDDNNWVYAPLRYWSDQKMFQFYCYAPHSSIEGTNVNLTSNSYGAMTNLQISHIRPYSAYDYTVADCYKIQNKLQNNGIVPFNMRQLSARICVRLKIGEEYAKMRKIKIKEVSVNDRSVGGTYFLCNVNLNSENPKDTTIEVTSNGAYTPTSDPAEILLIPIFDDPTGLELCSDRYQQFGSLYVMPQTITTLTINVKYDVYDNLDNMDKQDLDEYKKPIREDQRVTNTISFKNPVTDEFRTVESGKYYEINIVVSPEYLYVLSDHDVKPEYLISPE